MKVDDGFYKDVLRAIGAPVTENNVSILRKWQTFEGGNAAWNPLNTTQGMPGATDYNSVHVRNYPDRATGVAATAKTLTNRYYPDLVAAMRNDWPLSKYNKPNILAQMRIWGTTNFADYISGGVGAPATVTTGTTTGINKKAVITGALLIGGVALLIYANE